MEADAAQRRDLLKQPRAYEAIDPQGIEKERYQQNSRFAVTAAQLPEKQGRKNDCKDNCDGDNFEDRKGVRESTIQICDFKGVGNETANSGAQQHEPSERLAQKGPDHKDHGQICCEPENLIGNEPVRRKVADD